MGLKIATCVAVCLAAVAAIVYLPSMGAPVAPDQAQAFTRAEFITIVLTAVTVVLAAMAIMLAIAGFYGYVQLRASVHDVARRTAERVAREVAEPVAARSARAAVQRGEQTGADGIAEAFSDDSPGG